MNVCFKCEKKKKLIIFYSFGEQTILSNLGGLTKQKLPFFSSYWKGIFIIFKYLAKNYFGEYNMK
jgi:hypothetical protein